MTLAEEKGRGVALRSERKTQKNLKIIGLGFRKGGGAGPLFECTWELQPN